MMALAPGRLSTTPCCPQSSPIFCARTRACRSTPEPAACGTMMRMGRLGKSSGVCAVPAVASESTTALVSAASSMRLVIDAPPQCFCPRRGGGSVPGPVASRSRLTAGSGQRRTLGLSAPRRCAQHVHEFSHRARVFQIVDGVDGARDGGWAEYAVRVGAEFALDLSARQLVLGRTARMLAARLKRRAVALDLDHRLHAGERRIGTDLDLLGGGAPHLRIVVAGGLELGKR